MTGYVRLGRAIVYLVFVTFMIGCTTLRPLSLSNRQAVQSELQAGDEVKVTRKDGSAMSFGIDTVTDEGISGDGTLIAWSDMQQIEVREYSGAKTFILGAVVVGAVVLASSLDDGVDVY